MLEFRTCGMAGFSSELLAEPLVLRVQKRPLRVRARFAVRPEIVATREGPVGACVGDAVLTAASGEQWPVGHTTFARRYRTVPGRADDEYESLPAVSLALQVREPFQVLLENGAGRLSGRPGDWLVDYGDGQLGIVAADVFAATYRPLDGPWLLLHRRVQSVLLTGLRFPGARALPPAPPPAALAHLIAALAPAQAASNSRAIHAGNRYRSAFWGLYLLSPLAVLCAVMPLVLGWTDPAHALHAWAPCWALLEIVVIALLGMIFLKGHRNDWQGQWLASRTEAELARTLPLVAPLALPARPGAPASWYARLATNTLRAPAGSAIDALCAGMETEAAAALANAWSDPAFVAQYGAWAVNQFEAQRSYHQRVALRSEALLRRTHTINAVLFGLTFVGALAHLAFHSVWLSLVTICFPAVAASLHGAVAQSELFRLAAASRRLADQLGVAVAAVGAARQARDSARLRAAIESALILILDEHRDWHMLVRPHHLPLG